MANEYADRATLKQRMSVEVDDNTRDELLDSALAAASRGIDTATGRRFYLDDTATARTFTLSGRLVRRDGAVRLLVDDIGAAPVLVETGSGDSWTPLLDYDTAPDNALTRGRPITALARASSWGSATRARVTTRWGWPEIPAEITEATLIQASRLYKRKDSPEGVTGSAEWGVVRLSRRDPDVWALIEHFVLPGFG